MIQVNTIVISAIATQPIFPGAAVAQTGDTVKLAGSGILASHIVVSGAAKGGIVSMLAQGEVNLRNWTLATGSPFLIQGTTYSLGLFGRLVPNGSGQPVGIATSVETLSVSIQTNQTSGTGTSSGPTLASLQSQINMLVSQMQAIFKLFYALPKFKFGSWPIDNASNTGTVTGLGLTFTPTRVVPSVRIPSGGLVLFASIVKGSITTDGFTFVLNGLTDSADYILDFEIS